MIANVIQEDSVKAVLRDGRTIGYALSGDQTGEPILLIPGFGHSRLARHPDSALTASVGVKVISLDMPGIGTSSPQRGYTLLSWVDDVTQLVESLGLDRFSVIGWSWGAPYALAVAHKMPERIKSIGIVSGLAGWLTGPGAEREVKPEFKTFGLWCRYVPFAARAFVGFQGRAFMRNPQLAVMREAAQTGGDDTAVASQPAITKMLVDSGMEVWSHGSEGIYEHGGAVATPWGFDPAGIGAPVSIWHGDGDREIAPSISEHLAKSMRNASLTIEKGRGHLILFAEWVRILRSIRS